MSETDNFTLWEGEMHTSRAINIATKSFRNGVLTLCVASALDILDGTIDNLSDGLGMSAAVMLGSAIIEIYKSDRIEEQFNNL